MEGGCGLLLVGWNYFWQFNRLCNCVTGLDLSCSCLRGTITPNTSLFLLSLLQSLNLAYNDFNLSRISSGFGGFPSLTHLNLSSSQFYGQVPSELSHLFRLLSLDLSKIFLTIQTSIAERIVQNLTTIRKLIECPTITWLASFLSVLENISAKSFQCWIWKWITFMEPYLKSWKKETVWEVWISMAISLEEHHQDST